jgi:alcohol dehydrogenase
MRQLRFEGVRQAQWRDDAVAPRLGSDLAALVEPLVVSTCDMDAVAMSGAVRFRPGTPLGHEGVGVVVDIGDRVRDVRPGDHVIIPWQISCGSCERCRRGHDTFCSQVPSGSCYGWGPHVERWGGFLADLVEIPFADHMLVPLPAGVDPTWASGLSDNLVDAWRTVGPPLRDIERGTALILAGSSQAGGSIGLYAALFARALGAARVVVATDDEHLLDIAARLGVATARIPTTDHRDLGSFDVTVDVSGSADGLALALRSTGPSGTCTCVSGALHRRAPVPVPIYEMYMNVVTLRTGWVHTRSLIDTPLELIAARAFDPTVIASIHPFDDAAAAFAEPFTKLIFQRQAP